MAKPTPSVSGRVLEWARKRAALSHEQVAEHLKRKTIDAATVQSWERGESQPSPAQARSLVQLYRIPERWLLLDAPPTQYDNLGIVDFRAPKLGALSEPSLNLRGAIEHALALQAWVVEHRLAAGEAPPAFVAAKSPKQSPRAVARYIDEVFEVTRLRATAKNAGEFFARLRERVEDEGVLVLKMGQVANKTTWPLDPDEFKGFTIIDEERLAPLVFINRKDHEDAQLFTFVYELAHVVTGGSGVSNEDIEDLDVDKPKIEQFCDEVAEQVLVPSDELERVWSAGDRVKPEQIVAWAANLKVTPLILARRATRSQKLGERQFHKLAARWREAPQRKPGKGGPPPDRTLPSWYGRGLAELLASAACTGASDALELLGVKLSVARKIASRSRVTQRPDAAAGEHEELPKLGGFEPVRLDPSWKYGLRPEP